jgi:hypothetical protein
MKFKLIVLFLLLTAVTTVSSQTANIVTHKKVLINTDPSKGEKSFKAWGVFPE